MMRASLIRNSERRYPGRQPSTCVLEAMSAAVVAAGMTAPA
jgi:hypothetical protein